MIERRRLGGSALDVSAIGLGCMSMSGVYGPGDDAQSIGVIHRALDLGVNFLDSSDAYGFGHNETLLGQALRGRRQGVVLATKFGNMRKPDGTPGVDGRPEYVPQACDASLKRLGVDVIDLYFVHAPDPTVPLEDTLAALDALVRMGKVRALGASNFPAWLLAWAVALQDREGWAPFVSLQAQYSLVERSAELELLPFCRAAGLGVTAWGPLGAGFLTGRYRRDEPMPAGSRMAGAGDDLEEAPHRRAIERNFQVIDAAEEIARERGITVPQVALAWLLGVEGMAAPIIGPRTLEQLDGLLGADTIELTPDERARLEAPAPPPELYPHRLLADQLGLERVSGPLRRS
jgi:aryl-alcohol dehydrogenase-like predicted oxidoreductase